VAVAEKETRVRAEPAGIVRYSFFDRILHWSVALTFIYLMLSGFALGYPRMAWLFDVLGGGQTVRFLHPIVGSVFTVGIVVMFVKWLRDMLFERTDREWVRRLRTYTREGHTGLDVGRFNAGQKGYFWGAIVSGVLLLITGLPLWFPSLLSDGWNQTARLLHHVLFLFSVGAFILHFYLTTAMFPGTMQGMTTGVVSRRWAAWHHPRWFRKHDTNTRL
jgi:formate dehydrogenase subunit gamma